MSQILIIGNLGRDPEFRTAKSGTEYATLSVGYTHRKNKDDKEGHTTWYQVKAFDWLSAKCKHLKKGQKVLVQGRHAIEEYEDKNKVKQKSNVVYAQKIEGLVVVPRREESPEVVELHVTDDIPF